MGYLNEIRLNRLALSQKYYFLSLATEGLRCGLLSDKDIERIQIGSLLLLKDRTEELTGGESSSVRTETAQELLDSIFYVIGIALKRHSSPETAIASLKDESLKTLFEIGQGEIERRFKACRILHEQIKQDLFRTENEFYRSTVVDGINGFFKLYRPNFFAQKTNITADYPTFFNVGEITGIEFIEAYLQNIACENRFCRFFSPKGVHKLLLGCNMNYRQTPMNIYEPVLISALSCIITGREAADLCCNFELMKELLTNKSESETEQMLKDASQIMIAELSCTAVLEKYIQKSAPKIAHILKRALQFGNLDKVILTPSQKERKIKTAFFDGERMSDYDYEDLLKKIIQCDDTQQKADLILENIHSLGDLTELICNLEPTVSELVEILKHFPNEAIDVLALRYPYDEILSDEAERNICLAVKSLKANRFYSF